jgi:magnesium chelatase subunit D
LICGQKGTAKSTAVRSLASCLPEIDTVKGCRFNCDPKEVGALCDDCSQKVEKGERLPTIRKRMPVVDLPLGATEDRVIGTLDIEQAIKKGERHFQPGILAEANRGILYVDEVNLLDDHLVDILLDVVASGVNIVEREGVSYSHAARVILVGTMNPEEGELRPQLLDRFGLFVHVQGLDSVEDRAAIIQRHLAFESDASEFVKAWEESETALRNAILNARAILPKVVCNEKMHTLTAQTALNFGVDGHRTDLFMIKTAQTIAAFRGRIEVAEDEIQMAARLVLPHRMRKRPSESTQGEKEGLQKSLNMEEQEESGPSSHDKACSESTSCPKKHQGTWSPEEIFGSEKPYTVKHLSVVPGRGEKPRDGKRSTTEAHLGRGKKFGSMIPRSPSMDISFDATFRAAAPHQIHRDRGGLAMAIEYPDLREKRKSKRIAHTILFLVDASGWMGADQRMVRTKGAVLSLLNDAYKRRDRVGMVTFHRNKATVVLAPTPDKEKAKRALARLPVGGRTPLSKGLSAAHDALRKYALKMKDEALLLVVVSDGKANVSMKPSKSLKEIQEQMISRRHSVGEQGSPCLHEVVSSHAFQEALEVAEEIKQSGIKSLIIDTANVGRKDRMQRLSASMGGLYFKMEELRTDKLVQAVNASLNRPNTLMVALS